MNLDQLQIELRPRTIEQNAVLTVQLVHYKPRALLLAFLAAGACTVTLWLALLTATYPDPFLANVTLLVIGPLFATPVTVIAAQLVFSPTPSVRPALQTLMQNAPRLALMYVPLRLLTLALFLLLVLPGIWLWRRLMFVAPVVCLEGSSLRAAWKRLGQLPSGFQALTDRELGTLVLYGVYLFGAGAALIDFGLRVVIGRGISILEGLSGLVYTNLVCACSYALVLPLLQLMAFFFYLDLRVRKEGWDLELEFRRMTKGTPDEARHAA